MFYFRQNLGDIKNLVNPVNPVRKRTKQEERKHEMPWTGQPILEARSHF